MTTLTILTAARELLSDEARALWCRFFGHNWARDRSGFHRRLCVRCDKRQYRDGMLRWVDTAIEKAKQS
jgi:hypothetical protein